MPVMPPTESIDAALRDYLIRTGLLCYERLCMRPGQSFGNTWVLHRPASVDHGSCEARSDRSADECLAKLVDA